MIGNLLVTTLKIRDIFAFEHGVTVIVGEVEGDIPSRVRPVEATVLLGDVAMGSIHLTGERMPGPAAPRRQRSVETNDAFSWDRERVIAGDYSLRWGTTDV